MGVEELDTDAHDRLVLVTGGAGFLGTRTVQRLRSAGHPVAVLDDGSGGTLDRFDQLETDPTVRVHRVDLCDRDAVATVCERERPWAVVHLAARHFIPFCETHPQQAWQVNVEGTRNLLDALTSCQPRRFLFASTAEVYRQSASPHREDDPLLSPTVYGRSKLAAEQFLRETTLRWDTSLVLARLFNLYGPRHTVPHLIPTIVTQAMTGDHLRLGDLTTVRDFVYVDDAAAAIVGLLTRGADGPYNVGSGTTTSGEDMVELVAKLLGRDLTVALDPGRLRRHNRHALIADPTRLSRLLPWWPATPLDVGLRYVIDPNRHKPVLRAPTRQAAVQEGSR
ncbi:MAG: NAD-dependent epimerase/dehydratase family protein [Streptomycetales bacterium]